MKKKVDLRNIKALVRVLVSLMLLCFLSLQTPCILWAVTALSEFNPLVARIDAEGSVKVIARFDVPEIKNLTKISTSYTCIAPGASAKAGAVHADQILKNRINSVGYGVTSRLAACDYKLTHRFETIPWLALELNESGLRALAALPEVVALVEDRPVPLYDYRKGKPPVESASSKDNLSEPALDNTAGLIGAEQAWAMGLTGSGWYVAVLDTGIRTSHEFFKGKTIIEQCYSLEGDCPNGETEMGGSGSAIPYYGYSGYDHGTHVSGIAVGNNPEAGIFGVAKESNLIHVQVFSKLEWLSDLGAYSSDQLKGLEFVYSLRHTYNIASVNISIGGGRYDSYCDNHPLKAAVDNLRSVNIPTVISTGNYSGCGCLTSPACISTSVAVGASTDEDQEAALSNWHESFQSLFAPGMGINSATAESDTSYGSKNGTSMAAPHVAGAWALLRQNKPDAGVDQLLAELQYSGKPVITKCESGGSLPRIQVDQALLADMGSDRDDDGLLDIIETKVPCLNEDDADTDDDGIMDGQEDTNGNGLVDLGETNPCDSDSDDDGIQDGTEKGVTLKDIGPDTDLALFQPDLDPDVQTDPLEEDSDNDGLMDGEEDPNSNGRVDTGEDNPAENLPPVVDPGADQVVDEKNLVTLNGTNSNDPENFIESVLWQQTDGPDVVLLNPDSLAAGFFAPEVEPEGAYFEFQLSVTDVGGLTSTRSCSVTVLNVNLISVLERAGLMDLYTNTHGDSWQNNTGWGGPEGTECDWYGVTCDNDHVTGVSLVNNKLSGSIPSSIINLSHLNSLNLMSNQLTGQISQELGNLNSLRSLNLGKNQLTGIIPEALNNLTALTGLYLNDNQLNGSLPTWLGDFENLESLDFRNNRFTGPLPESLATLTRLSGLYLGGNLIDPLIPEWIGGMTALKYLYFENSGISGPIPDFLENLSHLEKLSLWKNHFTGPLPSWLGNLTGLRTLWLNGNMLQGEIPASLMKLTSLNQDSGKAGQASSIAWNALYSNDQKLIDFMNRVEEQGNWQASQTIAPSNIAAEPVFDSDILVYWNPGLYQGDTGGCEVWFRPGDGEDDFTLFGLTPDKSVNSMTVTGLVPDTRYEFRVRTLTEAHDHNGNRVVSEFTGKISATTTIYKHSNNDMIGSCFIETLGSQP